eukprot:CAMPEP_0174376328 /NCGR_PEP_ID=MMETSP0811_2-20130205/117818_1 /TAXON_ID=73025 ORGANISM="Eutreptiella gymnastica-like, Strain CCMP1594" /NCGR_SAMPLE_ID=MMETSP0811_2 /ASSEMBLY_ACC=CAM_ASM_000667 /LENGTH=97 /DNA_ID=CAMNT_0015527409 /DNA_START=103 /DNA_END=396 /DNA_ORIENTATION=+
MSFLSQKQCPSARSRRFLASRLSRRHAQKRTKRRKEDRTKRTTPAQKVASTSFLGVPMAAFRRCDAPLHFFGPDAHGQSGLQSTVGTGASGMRRSRG